MTGAGVYVYKDLQFKPRLLTSIITFALGSYSSLGVAALQSV